MILQVKATSLYTAHLNQADKPVDDNVRFRLFDRAAVVCSTEIVSLYCRLKPCFNLFHVNVII